jgi:putative ABC transport system substrate-binding protein
MRSDRTSEAAVVKGAIAAAVTAILLVPAAAGPSAEEEPPGIAVLMSHDAPPYQAAVRGFEASLLRNGINARYDRYSLGGDPAESARAVQRIKEDGVRLVYTLGAAATEAVIAAKIDAPLVACLLLNLADLERVPGAAGVALEIPVETQFQWLRRFLPGATRVGVIFNPKENQARVDTAARAARQRGLTLVPYAIETPRDLPDALNRLADEVDVLWSLPDHVAISPETARPLLLFSLRNRIPFVGLSTSWAKAGALYSLDRDYADLGAQCADAALLILGGRSPESLAPASPRTITYAINLKTARHLKIAIPDALIRGAAEVFE